MCAATGKVRYRDGDDAAAQLRTMRALASQAELAGGQHTITVCRKYRCDDCKGWHLTSMAVWKTTPAAPRPGTPAWRGPVPAAAPL